MKNKRIFKNIKQCRLVKEPEWRLVTTSKTARRV